jgi:cell wall-associated NlpC family hydrolase
MKAFNRAAVCGVLAIVLALGSGTGVAAACTCPVRTDFQCLDTAATGVGSPYWWGHAAWSTGDRDWKGADCSGFVVKAWQVPRTSVTWEDYHPYGTSDLFGASYHWYTVSRSTATRADGVGYPDPDGSGSATGHVVLYDRGDPYGTALVYEAPGSGLRIRHVWKDLSASKWRVRRRHNMIPTQGP